MTGSRDEHERTMAFAEIALGQIKALRQPAYPRNYEVWYAYATGYNPSLNQTINETLARNGTLTDADLEQIYDTYLSPARLTDQIDNVGAPVVDEIEQVMAMIDAAVGSATQLHREPRQRDAEARHRQGPRRPARHRRKPGADRATRWKQNNHALEQRLNASKQEINQLQENLEAVRNESLTDPLTALANRKYFDEALEQVRSRRAPPSERAAVAGDDRHRSLQDLQRHLRPSHRRPGAAARRACR